MMNKKNILVACAVIMGMLLSGCQLAKEDGLTAESSRLVGIYITNEYLDLFDFDGYFEDNISDFTNGGNIQIKNNDKYGGRAYAELRESPYTSEETGETHSTWNYVFPGLDGISFFKAEVTPPDEYSFIASFVENGVCDAHFSVGNDSTLEGTLYLAVTDTSTTIYINPVYQSSNGSVFVTTGEGYSTSAYNAEGTVFSTALEETYTPASTRFNTIQKPRTTPVYGG